MLLKDVLLSNVAPLPDRGKHGRRTLVLAPCVLNTQTFYTPPSRRDRVEQFVKPKKNRRGRTRRRCALKGRFLRRLSSRHFFLKMPCRHYVYS